MNNIDDKTKGTNKEVMQKILQSAYDTQKITKAHSEEIIARLNDISPLYAGLKLEYRKEDCENEEVN